MAPNHHHPDESIAAAPTNDYHDGLVFAAGNNKPSLVRSILARAPAAAARIIEAAWPAAVAAAAEAGDAYIMEILLQHQQQQLNGRYSSALQNALLVAADKGHGPVASLLLKQRAGPLYPAAVMEAAMARAVKRDHASVLQALLDKGKPDPHVLLEVDTDDDDEDGVQQQRTPGELAAACKSQRCVEMLKTYEPIWRQRTLQLLIRATLVDSSRLSTLPFVVLATGVLEFLAGRSGPTEPAGSIEEPVRVAGKRDLEDRGDEEAEEAEEEEEDFPPVLLQHQRGKRRRKSAGGRRSGDGGRHGEQAETLTRRKMLRPRKGKTWSELRKLPLPNDSFTGACAF